MNAPHPHGAMRRQDREITDRAQIDAILGSAQVMHLALSDNNVPFLVPLFYAYDGTHLYFHSAQAGTKIGILRRNPVVCFEVSVDHGIIPDENPCDFEARHRTVIGLGKAGFVTEPDEKVAALGAIVGRFTDQTFTFPQANLDRTLVVRIDINSMKGKSHGF
jgi:nitroimidazol reductase NimA-like FMN-containing flavoprotein (pyridoxamine 5'-phosphate oxidase superfamily)